MLIITNESQTEMLLESNYEKTEELNGTLQISFNSFSYPQNVGHNLIDFEVSVEDEDGHEYVVKQLGGDRLSKQVVAVHSYFSLADDFKYDLFGGTHTFDEFITFALSGTGWTFVNEDINESVTIPNFGNANPLVLINTLLSAFKCERQILPGKIIRFKKVIGEDNDLQFRYRHNIETLSYSVDTTNLKTQIKGYGANGLVVTYTSPLAAHPRIGVRIAEPIHDDRFTIAESLTEHIKAQLPEAPETNIEVKVSTVDGNVGDFVWLIHEDLNFEYQTRILSKKTKRNYNDSSVEVGNSTIKSITDILISQKTTIDQNAKQTRSKFEQTNDRITMEVEAVNESIATIEIRADAIEQSVIDLETNTNSKITQTATQIRAEITNVNDNLSSSITQTAAQLRTEFNAEVTTIEGNITTINNSISSLTQTASQLQSTISSQQTTVDNLGTRIANAESSITQTANDLTSKVSTTDYNGNTIASLINQSATTITLNASKINLLGITYVADSLQIGSRSSSGSKEIKFNGQNVISDDGSTLKISAMYMTLDSASGVVKGTWDFSQATSINWGSHGSSSTAVFG